MNKKKSVVSKLNYKASLLFIIVIISWLFPFIVDVLIKYVLNYNGVKSLFFLWFAPMILTIISFYQLKNNIIYIKFIDNEIIIRKYFGLGRQNSYFIEELDGYYTKLKESKGEIYEIIILIKSNKNVVNISQFYISNYIELKHHIINKLKITQ